MADVFYLCIIMMAYGPSFVKATIHGIVLNTVQSLASVPEVMANGMYIHSVLDNKYAYAYLLSMVVCISVCSFMMLYPTGTIYPCVVIIPVYLSGRATC